MKKTVLKFSPFVCFLLLLSSSFAQNIQINSTWLASGNVQQSLEGFGIDSTRIVFMNSGVFEIKYYQGGSSITETSTWIQVNTNQVDITLDENGPVVGAGCPSDEVLALIYTIVDDVFMISEVEPTTTCSGIDMLLTGSSWVNEQIYLTIDALDSDQFSIYPNPASEFVTINSYNNEEITSVLFISTTGSPIEVKRTDNYTFDVSNLEKGFYFLQITDNTGVKRLPRPIIVR